MSNEHPNAKGHKLMLAFLKENDRLLALLNPTALEQRAAAATLYVMTCRAAGMKPHEIVNFIEKLVEGDTSNMN
jgi:hypothetical protein